MLSALLRYDRTFLIAGLVGTIFLSWAYLLAGAGMDMHSMRGMAMSMAAPVWTPGYFALTFAMWAIMMAAMMLPSAAPMLLLYEKVVRQRSGSARTIFGDTGLFALGYLAVWAGFSAGAMFLQYISTELSFLSPMLQTTNMALAGALLVVAGIYQWTPLKQTCLRCCRSALEFIMAHWRGGGVGAFTICLRHGAFCLGCCWMLMLLLFVGGVMNVLWIAGLAIFVLVEKLAPGGGLIGCVGILLVAWGGAVWISLVVEF